MGTCGWLVGGMVVCQLVSAGVNASCLAPASGPLSAMLAHVCLPSSMTSTFMYSIKINKIQKKLTVCIASQYKLRVATCVVIVVVGDNKLAEMMKTNNIC